MIGLVVPVLGHGVRGTVFYRRLKNLPVHPSMRAVSETIYATCKTYMVKQLLFILLLEVFIGAVLIRLLRLPGDRRRGPTAGGREGGHDPRLLAGSASSAATASAGSASASTPSPTAGRRWDRWAGKAFPGLRDPAHGRHVDRHGADQRRANADACCILLFVPRRIYAGPCFIGFAVGESLGAAALRVAGGIFTKIADIGADLMKIVFNVKEDDARNPGVIADCTGDNAGDSVGPTADGFETYGVTGVALITFILLGMPVEVQATLLVWIFAMRLVMVLTSGASYLINERLAKARFSSLARWTSRSR